MACGIPESGVQGERFSGSSRTRIEAAIPNNMFNKIKSAVKDVTSNLAFQGAFNVAYNLYQLNKLGRYSNLSLSSKNKELSVTLDLDGEVTPIDLHVRYRVVDETTIDILEVRSSRKWIETLFNEVIPAEKKLLKIPNAAMKFL